MTEHFWEGDPDLAKQAPLLASAPEVRIAPGELRQAFDQAVAALKRAKVSIYDRGGALYRPVRVESSEIEFSGVKRKAGATILVPVTAEWLHLQLAEAASWLRFDRRKAQWVAIDPPPKIAAMILGAPDEGGWPYLRGIVCHPVLLPDGRIITARGYNADSGLLIDAQEDWLLPASRPARDEAVAARKRLEHLLRNFPFIADADRAVALSILLTAIMRRVLRTAPGHAADAPAPGTGKSLLMDVAAIVATGAPAAVLDYGQDQIEAAKRLDAALLAGDAIINIDNVEIPLEGATLCETLTQTTRRVRPLGTSQLVTVPCVALITATGNNLTLRGDIVRRILVCRLDAKVERPELREIDQDILSEVYARRREIIRDVLTVLLAYIVADRPDVGLTPLGSFEQWSAIVRNALVWSGAVDPVGIMERTRQADPMRIALETVFSAWRAAFLNEAKTAADAVHAAATNSALGEALGQVATKGGRLDVSRLGYWLRSKRDLVIGGLRLCQVGDRTGKSKVAQWAVLSQEEIGGMEGIRGDAPTLIIENPATSYSGVENISPHLPYPPTENKSVPNGLDRSEDALHDIAERLSHEEWMS